MQNVAILVRLKTKIIDFTDEGTGCYHQIFICALIRDTLLNQIKICINLIKLPNFLKNGERRGNSDLSIQLSAKE